MYTLSVFASHIWFCKDTNTEMGIQIILESTVLYYTDSSSGLFIRITKADNERAAIKHSAEMLVSNSFRNGIMSIGTQNFT